ncbi:ATP-binding protein [Streptosporangium canum]|uniref:ATP-binding protein n=1 Tax=Streptosporangium canum TaxID=324952 RepID=UPI0037909D21
MRADVFVGRQTELAEVSALLSRARHVTLTGTAGVGKTCLALRVARTLEDEFPGGVHVVDLSDAPADLTSLAGMLADVIGVDRRPGVPVLKALVNGLVPRRSLIVLDTCDRVVGTAGILADLLLRSVEELRILVTSRQRLGLPGEHLYQVDGLRPDDAVELLTILADRRLDGVEPAEICGRLDNLPLAIELAAAGPDPATTDVFAAAADTRRHSSMRAAYGWSHELCSPQERLLWARASIFAGTFDLEAAEDVCAADGLGAAEVLDTLLGLLDKSVLTREEGECGVRYRMPGTVREFGAGWLDLLGETGEMRRRHRDHFLALSARAEVGWQCQQLEWYRRLVLECANVRQAIEYCYSRPEEHRKGLDLVGNLWFLWACCGMHAPGDNFLQQGLDLDPTPSPERIKALWVHAWVSIQRGDLVRAERTLAACVAEDSQGYATAYVSQFQAHLAVLRGDVGEALRLIRNARVRHRSTGNVFPGFLPTYTVVATAMILAGNHGQAVSVLQEGRDLCDSCGDQWTLIRLDLLLALAEHLLGNTAEAVVATHDSLRGARLFGDTFSMLEALEVSAVIAEAGVDDALAALLLGASYAAWTRAEVPPSRSPMLTSLLRTAKLRLRGRMGRADFERLTGLGASTSLETAVEHALRETFS